MTQPTLFRRRALSRLALALLVAYSAVVAVLLLNEDRLVFHPIPASQRWLDSPSGYAVHDIELHTAEGARIHARWFPREVARSAVLICHSRAGNLSLALRPSELAGWHDDIGASVLIFDYPGYGRSEGRPSEAGCYAAATAAFDWLTQSRQISPLQILIYGRSLGSAVAVELASRRPHRALILVSPPTSLPDVALSFFPLLPARQLMHNRFDSLARIDRCSGPVFIVHGTRDRTVPFAHGERLFARANQPKQLFTADGAHHGDCITPAFFPALREFLLEHGQQ